MVDWVILQADVEKHPKFSEISLEEILKDFGMDVKKGYIIEDKTKEEKPEDWPEEEPFFGYNYRSPFTDELSKGPRYVGVARSDGKWRRFVSDFLELQY